MQTGDTSQVVDEKLWGDDEDDKEEDISPDEKFEQDSKVSFLVLLTGFGSCSLPTPWYRCPKIRCNKIPMSFARPTMRTKTN